MGGEWLDKWEQVRETEEIQDKAEEWVEIGAEEGLVEVEERPTLTAMQMKEIYWCKFRAGSLYCVWGIWCLNPNHRGERHE